MPDSNFLQSADLVSDAARWRPSCSGSAAARRRGGTRRAARHEHRLGQGAAGGNRADARRPQTPITVRRTDLAFEVTVQDSGDSQEVQHPGDADDRPGGQHADRQDADDRPHQRRRDQGDRHLHEPRPAPVREQTTLKVDVQPVPGETNTTTTRRRTRSSSRLAGVSVLERDRRLDRDRRRRGRGSPRSRSSCVWVLARGCAASARRSACCSAAAGATSSTSPSRSRAGSTTCTARSTRSPRPRARRPPGRRLGHEHVDRPLRRLRGHGRPPVRLARAARRGRTGVVVTAIQGRDYARIYMKELDRGRASVALSPEEQEAVERAMAR